MDEQKSTKKTAKKVTKKKAKKGTKSNPLDELLIQAKQRGFVTEDEIIHVMPQVETDVD